MSLHLRIAREHSMAADHRDPCHRRPRGSWFQRVKNQLATWRGGPASPPKMTPEQDKLTARQAIGEGDYAHAAFHVAGALYENPNDREALDLADELARLAPDPLELVPLQEQNYAGAVALRAYFLAQSDLPGALNLLRQVIVVDKDKPFEFWALRWLETPEALRDAPTIEVVGILSLVIARFPGDVAESPSQVAKLIPWLAIAHRFTEARPDDAAILAVASLIVRRSGDLRAALDLAERSYRAAPSYMAAVARAMVHERLANLDAAMAAYNDGLKHEPESAEILADMALLELRRREFSAAMDCTRRGLKSNPQHRTLVPLSLFLQYRLHEDKEALSQLEAFVRTHPAHIAAGWLDSLQPFIGRLPDTGEATLNVITQILPKLRDKEIDSGSEVTLTISSLEAPSMRLAVERALAHFQTKLVTTVEKIGSPDPRVACKPVRYELWAYDGTEPRPAIEAPAPAISQAIAEIASEPYDLWAWGDRARKLAARMNDQHVPHLLAVSVHPPAAPSPEQEPQWVLGVQFAVALTISQLEGFETEGSAPRDAILSMLFGPVDWTNIAAVIALLHYTIRRQDAKVSESLAHLYFDRLNATPRPGHCCFTFPTLWALTALPKIDAKTHQDFVSLYNDFMAQQG